LHTLHSSTIICSPDVAVYNLAGTINLLHAITSMAWTLDHTNKLDYHLNYGPYISTHILT